VFSFKKAPLSTAPSIAVPEKPIEGPNYVELLVKLLKTRQDGEATFILRRLC
jgi:hypothetical protein